MKISEIYGKKTLGADGREGYALSVSALGQKVYLTCADSDEREFTVEAESVKKLGDAIIYDGKESRADGALPVRLGRASFDTRGNFLGLLSDLTLSRGKLKTAKIGKKNYPVEILTMGDVVIVDDATLLKEDVTKDGRQLFLKGSPVTKERLARAAAEGEYIQTTLKTI